MAESRFGAGGSADTSAYSPLKPQSQELGVWPFGFRVVIECESIDQLQCVQLLHCMGIWLLCSLFWFLLVICWGNSPIDPSLFLTLLENTHVLGKITIRSCWLCCQGVDAKRGRNVPSSPVQWSAKPFLWGFSVLLKAMTAAYLAGLSPELSLEYEFWKPQVCEQLRVAHGEKGRVW